MSDAQKKKRRRATNSTNYSDSLPFILFILKKRFLKQKYTSNVNGSVYTM